MLLTLDSLISEEKERRRSVQELAKQAGRGIKGAHSSTGPSLDTESITTSIRKIVATDAEEEEKVSSSFILREVPKSDSRSTAAGPSSLSSLSLSTEAAMVSTASHSYSALGKALSSAVAHKQWVTDVLYLSSALSKTAMRRLLSAPTLIANAFPTEFNEYFELLKTPRQNPSSLLLTSQTAYGSAFSSSSLYSRPTSFSSYSGSEAYFLAIAHAWRRVVVEDKKHRSFFTQGKGLLSYARHSSAASRKNGDASLAGSVLRDSKTRILFCENSVTFFVELLKSAVEIDRRWKRQSDGMSIISAAGQRKGPLKDNTKRDCSFLTQFAAVVIGGVLPKTLGVWFSDASAETSAVPTGVDDCDSDLGGANPMPLQLISAIFLALLKERSSLSSVWLSAWLSWDFTTETTLSVLTSVVEQCAEEMAMHTEVDKEEGGEGVIGVTARVLNDCEGDDAIPAEDEEVVERLEEVVSVVADAVWGLLFVESIIVPAWLTVWRFARALLEKAEERLTKASGLATNRKGMHLLVAKALTSVVQNTICDRVVQEWSSPDFVYTYDGSSVAGGKGSAAGGGRGHGDHMANLLLCFLTMVPSSDSRPAKRATHHHISLIFSSSSRKDSDYSDESDADSVTSPKDGKRSSVVSLKIPLASIFDGINHHFSATNDGPRKIGATVAVAYTSIMAHLHPSLGSGKNKKPSGKKSAEDGEDLDEDDILSGGALDPLAPLDFDAYPQCLPAWLNDTLLRSLRIFSPQTLIRGSSSGGGALSSTSTLFGLSVVPPFVALVNDSSALASAIAPAKEGGGGQVLAGGSGRAGDATIAAVLSHRQAQQAAKNTASSGKKAAASFVNMGSIPIARLLPLPLPSLSADPNIAVSTTKANSSTSLRRIQLRGRIVIKKGKGNMSSEDTRDDGSVGIDGVANNLNLPVFGKTSFVETPKQVGASAYLGGQAGGASSASSLPAVRTLVEGLRLLCAIGAKPNESERDRALATEAALRALPSLLRSLVMPPALGSNGGSSYFLLGNSTNTSTNGTLHHERVVVARGTTTNETDNYPTAAGAGSSSRHFLIVGDASSNSADGHVSTTYRSFAEELLVSFPSSQHGRGVVVPSRDRDEQAMISRRRDPFAIAESAIAPMASHAILALVCCDVVFPQTMQAEMDALRLEVLTLIMAMCPLVSLHQASIMLFHSNFSVSQRVMLYHGLQGALRLWADAPRSGAEAQSVAPLAAGDGQNMNSPSSPSSVYHDTDSNKQNKTSVAPAERRVYPPIEDDAHVTTMSSARETIAARIEQKTRRWGHAVKGRGSHNNNGGLGGSGSTSNKGEVRVQHNRVHLFAEAVVTALLEFYDENERMKRRQTDAKNGPKRSQLVTELAGSDGDSASSQGGRSIHSFSFLAEADMLYAPAELLRTIHVLFENFVTPAGSIITLSTRVLPFLQEAVKHPHAIVRAQAWATITTVMIQFSLAVQTVEEPAARNVLFAFLGALTPVARAALGGGGGGGRGRGTRSVTEPETSALCRATITEFINLAMSIVGM